MSIAQVRTEPGKRSARAATRTAKRSSRPKTVVKKQPEPRAQVIERVVNAILDHDLSWDELHRATMRAQAEKLIQPVREVIEGREFNYLRLGEYVIAMHQLCGGLPVVKYRDETGAWRLTRINAGVIYGYLKKGWSAEEVAADFRIPVEPVQEVGELAALFDYDRSYA